MSFERGIEHLQFHESGVDQFDFAKYLKALIRRNPGKRLAIYCDQLTAHKTDYVLRFLAKKGVE